jgi:PleD family two-component response regulator
MDAYTSSSAPSRRASVCVRLAGRILDAVREMQFATQRTSELMLSCGLAESDRAPDTYAEFLLRTRAVVRHEPAARRRSAGSQVR